MWFQKPGEEPVEEFTYQRSNAWDMVREESLAVREGVGMWETTGFSKFSFGGPGARDWLGRILAGRIPRPGRMSLTPMTNHNGKLIGDVTLGCLPATPGEPEGPESTFTGGATGNTTADSERFFMFGSGIAGRYYQRWFDQHLPADGSVNYRSLGWEMCGLSIAGPKSRELLERVTGTDVSADAFKFMAFQQLNVGQARVLSGRVTYTGDLGFEFWMPASYQRYVYDLLMEAGEDVGLRLFGLHTLNSLRLEKSFGSWAREFRPIYDPFEAGLDRFCDLERDFIGRDALLEVRDQGPERRLLTWTVDVPAGRDQSDVMGDEPIWRNGEVVGWVTSGGYAHHSDVSVAMGYVPAELEHETGGWQIEILGDMRDATLQPEPIWDPQAAKMRG